MSVKIVHSLSSWLPAFSFAPKEKYENFVTTYIEVVAECIATKLRTKCRVLWESITFNEKPDNLKKGSLLNKIDPTDTDVQKLKKP